MLEHRLDGYEPSLFLDAVNRRHMKAGKKAALSDMVSVANSFAGRTYIDETGTLQAAPANTPRIDYASGLPELLLEGDATNYAENAGNAMAVVGIIGSGGAIPNFTQLDGLTGITREVKAIGITDGIPWTEIRIYGTNTAGSKVYPDPGPTARPTAAVGEAWTASVWIGLVAGAWPSVSGKLACAEYSAANGYLTGTPHPDKVTAWKRYSVSRTFSNASVAKARAFVSMEIQIGETVDFTYRIGGWQLEKSQIATSLILTSGTALTRTKDTCTLPSSAGDMTAWAWRGYVPSLFPSQGLLGASGGLYIRAGNADPTVILLEGNNTNTTGTPGGQLPGSVGFCGGWGASGRRVCNNGGNTGSDNGVPNRIRTAMYIGSGSGLASGQVLRVRQLVAWALPDRPSEAGVRGQARAAT